MSERHMRYADLHASQLSLPEPEIVIFIKDWIVVFALIVCVLYVVHELRAEGE